MSTEKEKQIILQMSGIRVDKLTIVNKNLDLEEQIQENKNKITSKDSKLNKLHLRLDVIRMESKE